MSESPNSVPRRRGWLRRLVLALSGLAGFLYFAWVLPFWGFPFNGSRHGRVPVTPPWALECWLWEDDTNTADAVRELLEGYATNDIPVRTVLIDSPWSTRYNDFEVDEKRYPTPAKFFGDLQEQGYRVVLWMTCLVNRRNSDTAVRDAAEFHSEARKNGFLAGDGYEVRWWKGRGSFIDYTNPDALAWWHGMQRQVLGWGIDGWKLDGADTLFSSHGVIPYQRTKSGWISTRTYMDLYNREEYRHGLSKNPEFIVLTRAIDDRYFPLSHPEGFAPLDAAPVTWVGDRIHAWSSKKSADGAGGGADAIRDTDSWLDRGFEGALRDILASAKKGYCVVGDDVGGYHGAGPIPPRLYIRWAQFAAFTGLFLNGGHGERRLWKRSRQELEIIRRYAWLHTELVPYMYTHVVRCHEGGPPLMRPTGKAYGYQFGDDLFVAPIYRDNPTNTVHLPPGRWRQWFHDSEVIEGPSTFDRVSELDDFPVYVREGAIIPMNVSRAYTGFGDRSSEGLVSWVIYPSDGSNFEVVHPDLSGRTRVSVLKKGAELRIGFDGVRKPHILRVHAEVKPISVELDGSRLEEGKGWEFDGPTRKLIVRTQQYGKGSYRIRFPE